ncbi:putative CDT1-like protein a, chloroplastic-like [Capsicum annuum]|nr:putative CDT1-like protein a, chloroplastic-like [Capsicum annuum]
MEDCLSDACHLRDLRLLRVLILSDSFMKVKDSLLNEIGMLNHLRYLYIGIGVKSLPSSFSNLRNLETLWVKNEGSTLVLLPSIWDLSKLRVLFMTACSFFDMDTDEPILIVGDSKLENLRELAKLVFSYSKETEDIFIRFPNLQWLVFYLKESWDYSTERYWFPKLDFLSELEVLRVDFKSSNTNDSGPSLATNWSWDFHFPSNLKKLSLRDFSLTSDSLSTVVRLPNLEELSLVSIQEEEWSMRDEDIFLNLKYLQLYGVNPAKLEFGEESFPLLEKLVMQKCRKLKEIPHSFGDSCSLKIIQLVESPQLKDSAFEIKQYVEDNMGEDKLQILGLNNIQLSKTDPENLEGMEGEATLFTYTSRRAAAMPALRVCCYRTPVTSTNQQPISIWCCGAAVSNDQDVQIGVAFGLVCTSPPCLSASFTDEHASPVPLSRILKASIVYSRNLTPFESFWGGTFKSIKYRIDELDEEKSVI